MRPRYVYILITLLSLATRSATPARPPQAKPQAVANGLFSEIRLRKLHLARPDLIPYPFAYEVYC